MRAQPNKSLYLVCDRFFGVRNAIGNLKCIARGDFYQRAVKSKLHCVYFFFSHNKLNAARFLGCHQKKYVKCNNFFYNTSSLCAAETTLRRRNFMFCAENFLCTRFDKPWKMFELHVNLKSTIGRARKHCNSPLIYHNFRSQIEKASLKGFYVEESNASMQFFHFHSPNFTSAKYFIASWDFLVASFRIVRGHKKLISFLIRAVKCTPPLGINRDSK